ncbi:GDSL-type esterase/lipase family protein [Peribacillus kribbensis]|uniref:GDSL-type esterase/lipase family protein n=1 Tax=Peribacillus kribbensis TaxID=356658 RepID=UPI00040FC240|nr:GDSL-type esterase/lipase family protein [Peribacillus kribbensis]
MKKFNLIILPILLVIACLAAYIFNRPEDEKGKRVITALGDSLTYGLGDSKGTGYVSSLENKLNQKNSKVTYDAKSFGVIGQKSGALLLRLAEPKMIRQVENSDYIILYIGTNDLVKNSRNDNLSGLPPKQLALAKKEYLHNLTMITEAIHVMNHDAPIIVLGLYNPYPNTGKQIETYIDNWNESVQGMTKDKQYMTFIPTNQLFKGKRKRDYFYDSLHVNDKGYDLLADHILKSYHF